MNPDLAPLRHELEKRAADEVARIEEEAQGSRKGIEEEARAEATRRKDQARRQGEAMADAESTRRMLMERREAGRRVLEARRDALDELRQQCLRAAEELRASEDYESIEEALVDQARRVLGDGDCRVERDPGGKGGVRATSGTRLVDLSLPALVDRCLAGLGADAQELWT
jgi:vacuolar-type H+-ATPase subunit E/Vma4